MDETHNIYTNEDCMDLMARYPDRHFDLAIVDPPYGIGEDKLHSKRRLNGAGKLKNRAINLFNTEWDYSIPDDSYFKELFRISKNQIIWGGNYFNLPPARCIICWDKCQPWDNFSSWEMGWTSFDKPANIFHFDNRIGGKIHPTQKPVALYEWLLSKYAKNGDIILDTHCGSASSLIACENLDFEYVACEKDPDYYQESLKRLRQHTAQKKLFSTQLKKNETEKELFNG